MSGPSNRDRVVAPLQPCPVKRPPFRGRDRCIWKQRLSMRYRNNVHYPFCSFCFIRPSAQRCSVLSKCAGLGFCAIRHPLSLKTVRLRGVRRYTGLTGCRGGPDVYNDYPHLFSAEPKAGLSGQIGTSLRGWADEAETATKIMFQLAQPHSDFLFGYSGLIARLSRASCSAIPGIVFGYPGQVVRSLRTKASD